MRRKFQVCVLVAVSVTGLFGCASEQEPPSKWGKALAPEMHALGYRNWVVVADAAFPVHSRRGVRTLVLEGEIPEILEGVLEAVEREQNVTPRIHLARELREVPNDRAPGIDEFRAKLEKALHGHPTREMEERSLALMLEDSANTFSVLVLKTRTTLPYTSIFIELDSAYWDAESERDLRNKIEKPAEVTAPGSGGSA